jgi:hypothetical protein
MKRDLSFILVPPLASRTTSDERYHKADNAPFFENPREPCYTGIPLG